MNMNIDNFICPITQDIMSDPVICADGITYERKAIEHWLQSHSTSPVTRQPLNSSNLITNYALKNMIEDYKKQPKQVNKEQIQVNKEQIQVNKEQIQVNTNKNKTKNHYRNSGFKYEDNFYSIVELIPQNPNKKDNIVVAVVDTSGSMDESADVPNSKESSGLSRLDLVKHTLNTIVHSLGDNDLFLVIQFSNTAKICSDFMKLTQTNKNIVLENIKKLKADGMTNLWAGINLGLSKLKDNNNSNSNISMLIMTDGVSNSDPPRGIVQSLKDYITTNNLRFPINTFGYGYNIDSTLLSEISSIGHGFFGFIPDATMVGTIFINILANIINGCYNNIEVNSDVVQLLTPNVYGMCTRNQPIHIILKSNTPINNHIRILCDEKEEVINIESTDNNPTINDLEQLFRIELIEKIKNGLQNGESSEIMKFRTILQSYNSSYINAIKDDIYNSDANKGQLEKALSKREWLQLWGSHYLKSIIRAHQFEKCLTFKESSPQFYNSDDFKVEQTRIEKIFCDLPAPNPSNAYSQLSYSYYSYPYTIQPNQSSTPVSMSTYYVQDGGCFDGNGKVKLYDYETGKIYYKLVKDIVKGDKIYNSNNNKSYVTVECTIKFAINKTIKLCQLNNMYITPFHPIFHNNKWEFPNNIKSPIDTYIDYVYDFVLDSGHIVEINDLEVLTLGHNFDFNDVVRHEYFGKNIINDLEMMDGWNSGEIVLDFHEFIRDATSKVVGLKKLI